MSAFTPRPYPIDKFPPRIRAAVLEIMRLVPTTDVIASMSVLTALSSVIGCIADWRHPVSGQVRPSTLYLWVVALSGEGKSPSDGYACSPIYSRDISAIQKFDEDKEAYQAANAGWRAIEKGLLSRIAKFSRAGESTAEAEAKLAAHALRKPIKPILNRMIGQDVSFRSLCEALEGDGKSIVLVTNEGQTLLFGNLMRHIGQLNSFWGGAQLSTCDRADHDSIVMLNPRVTISMMVQPYVMAEYLSKGGAMARGSGHWARYLIASSPSIQGYRSVIGHNATLVDLVPYHARLADLLRYYEDKAGSGVVTRDVLEFDDPAKELWQRIATNIEADIKPGYFLHDIHDFGSKLMDIVGRLAALLHYFEANTDDLSAGPVVREQRIGKISADALSRAHDIAMFHLMEYKEVFSPPLQRSPEEIDADQLYAYLYRAYFARHMFEVSKNLIRQYGGVRHKRFDPAICALLNRQAITIKFGKNNTQIIELNRSYFTACPV